MIFDQMCGVIERHAPKLIPVLKRAHLFEFPGDPQTVLPKGYADDQVPLLIETFFLPFEIVAIEDAVSCVVLIDSARDQTGLDRTRFFIEGMAHDRIAEREGVELNPRLRGAVQITTGRVSHFKIDNTAQKPLHCEGNVTNVFIASKREMVLSADEMMERTRAEWPQLSQHVLRNVIAAFEEIVFFNTPNRFVVQKSPRVQVGNPNLAIPRSDSRSRYILLTPHEIQEQLALACESTTEGGRTKTAHLRRKHYRRLQSDRFKEARGKTLVIPATWIGASETDVGAYHYRIRLDL